MENKLQESINYFKNRTSFEIPVYETKQFQEILKELRYLQRVNEANIDYSYDMPTHGGFSGADKDY